MYTNKPAACDHCTGTEFLVCPSFPLEGYVRDLYSSPAIVQSMLYRDTYDDTKVGDVFRGKLFKI
jgi:hypothetical protein